MNSLGESSAADVAKIATASTGHLSSLQIDTEVAPFNDSSSLAIDRWTISRRGQPVVEDDRAASSPLAELQALRRAAHLGNQQKLLNERQKDFVPRKISYLDYAEPLAPLRERDLTALTELFQQEEILAIEVDINQMLLRLLPEPCWEDDPFEFLHEFL